MRANNKIEHFLAKTNILTCVVYSSMLKCLTVDRLTEHLLTIHLHLFYTLHCTYLIYQNFTHFTIGIT